MKYDYDTGEETTVTATKEMTYSCDVTRIDLPLSSADGKVRDLLLRLDLSQASNVPLIGFSGGTWETDSGSFPENEVGVNLWSFTETKAGRFAVSKKMLKET